MDADQAYCPAVKSPVQAVSKVPAAY